MSRTRYIPGQKGQEAVAGASQGHPEGTSLIPPTPACPSQSDPRGCSIYTEIPIHLLAHG